MIKIELQEWWEDADCGNGCCMEVGTKLIIDGKEVDKYFGADASDVRILLTALGIKYELKETYSEEVEAIIEEAERQSEEDE